MRIAYDHQIFTMQRYGGISRYILRLSEEITALGSQARIFAPLHCNKHLSASCQAHAFGFFLGYPPSKIARLARPLNEIFGRCAARVWRPDLVHETYYAASRPSRKRRPVVVTVHDMIHELCPDAFHPRDRTTYFKRRAVENADRVICISENTRRDLIRIFSVPPEKAEVIYHGVDSPAMDDFQPSLMPEGSPYLLYVGNRDGYKNFEGFLTAFAASKSLRNDFRIMAFGGGAFSAAESRLIRRLRLDQDTVRQFSGGDNVLCELYANASAFVYPSLYEGFGFPPLEAMSHGCPVVSSNTSSMPEVIGHAAKFFDPTSTEDIKEAIEAVVYSDQLRLALIETGNRQFKQFSWRKCAAKTLSLYEKVSEQFQ